MAIGTIRKNIVHTQIFKWISISCSINSYFDWIGNCVKKEQKLKNGNGTLFFQFISYNNNGNRRSRWIFNISSFPVSFPSIGVQIHSGSLLLFDLLSIAAIHFNPTWNWFLLLLAEMKMRIIIWDIVWWMMAYVVDLAIIFPCVYHKLTWQC